MKHTLSNIDAASETGDCAVCGVGVRLKKNYGKGLGTFRCRLKYMETKYGSLGRFGDGTVVTQAHIDALMERQERKCAICGVQTELVIDHCHNDRILRGLLCNSCNLGLGKFKDDAKTMRKAVEYLTRTTVFVI